MPENEHDDVVFSVFGALDRLNTRLKAVEKASPDYTADMLEVYRNMGVLTKRIEELEVKLKQILMEE